MERPELTIIVPVYNEEATLTRLMLGVSSSNPKAQVVYVDDGSTDKSLAILREHARAQDSVIQKQNGGKGSAVREGLLHAKGLMTVIQDADLEYNPSQIPLLVAEANAHPGSVIFGSRFLQRNPTTHWRFLLGNKVLTFALRILFGGTITDSYTCYKLLPSELFRSLPLQSRGYELEAEISAWCLKKNIPVREIPIIYVPRSVDEGKKIRGLDAIRGCITLLRVRFS